MTHKSIHSKNGNTHYWISEKKENSIIFIHGAMMDHNTFKEQIDYFSKDNTVITVDVPWHGLSQPYHSFNLKNAADEIVAILKKEQINTAHFVGQSMGGLIAQIIALQNSPLVKSLTVIGSAPLQPKYYQKNSTLRFERFVLKLFPYKFLVKEMAKKIAYSQEGQRYVIEVMKFNTKHKLLEIMKILATDAPNHLSETILNIPLLITYGDADKTANIAAYCKQWAQLENRPLTIIENAAHNANIDNPTLFNTALSNFLESV